MRRRAGEREPLSAWAMWRVAWLLVAASALAATLAAGVAAWGKEEPLKLQEEKIECYNHNDLNAVGGPVELCKVLVTQMASTYTVESYSSDCQSKLGPTCHKKCIELSKLYEPQRVNLDLAHKAPRHKCRFQGRNPPFCAGDGECVSVDCKGTCVCAKNVRIPYSVGFFYGNACACVGEPNLTSRDIENKYALDLDDCRRCLEIGQCFPRREYSEQT